MIGYTVNYQVVPDVLTAFVTSILARHYYLPVETLSGTMTQPARRRSVLQDPAVASIVIVTLVAVVEEIDASATRSDSSA